jgi:xanthine dehydrogenase FAD-binding subunit
MHWSPSMAAMTNRFGSELLMNIENYSAPSTLAEAAQLLQQGQATIVAGGTDLTPQIEAGTREFAATLVNIQRIEAMRGITATDGHYRIGGLTTITEILESRLLAAEVPVLVQAADHFASPQIRNASTLAGNLCNASPAGDMCIPLLLLDARVELASWADGSVATRSVALAEFFIAPGKTVMQADELLTAVVFTQPVEGFAATFIKSGPRPALEIATVSMGVAGVLKDGVMHGARVAIGAVAPTPLRAAVTEAVLEGRVLNEDAIREAVESVQQEVSPIDDVRASAWYRKHLTGVYIRRALVLLQGAQHVA